MTILAKLTGEKKDLEKVPLPLHLNDEAMMHHGSLISAKGGIAYSDADTESMVFNRPQHTCLKSFLLFLIAVIVMLLGVLGGWTLYRFYAPNHANMRYHALCDIPYAEDSAELPRFYPRNDDAFALNWRSLLPLYGPSSSSSSSDTLMNTSLDDINENFFREEIELDNSDDDGYAKIDVPDFKDGRRGRFMHDFRENQSAIVDTTTNRCFIMPLDRETTLPPSSFVDLMQKMGTGYYNIDTERVRRNMRVITPRITDVSSISERIANECYDMKIYMLEKFVSGVAKRSADPLPEAGKYAEFMGKGVIEYDLSNIAEVEAYEANEEAQRQGRA
ncbi:integral membrane protein 2B [Drosophila nasuta]|uniref:Integral membrane protein 2 n=1 Tax=Drosophila albomicans TaxID=7291 RepID=A0A6P8WPW8_DROAB|nr:integral membrane protein 2B [Drosophila albomicans]XP_060666141.1 integral membrane protein 2B [Drosophila nasuta]